MKTSVRKKEVKRGEGERERERNRERRMIETEEERKVMVGLMADKVLIDD